MTYYVSSGTLNSADSLIPQIHVQYIVLYKYVFGLIFLLLLTLH